jgi:hypothetical protein
LINPFHSPSNKLKANEANLCQFYLLITPSGRGRFLVRPCGNCDRKTAPQWKLYEPSFCFIGQPPLADADTSLSAPEGVSSFDQLWWTSLLFSTAFFCRLLAFASSSCFDSPGPMDDYGCATIRNCSLLPRTVALPSRYALVDGRCNEEKMR